MGQYEIRIDGASRFDCVHSSNGEKGQCYTVYSIGKDVKILQ